jgi:hypothetical protein
MESSHAITWFEIGHIRSHGMHDPSNIIALRRPWCYIVLANV